MPKVELSKEQLQKEAEIIPQFFNLAGKMANKFYRKNPVYSLEDLFQVACMALVKAYRRYDPDRASLITIMHICVFTDLVKFVTKFKRKASQIGHTIVSSTEPNLGLNEYLPPLDDKSTDIVNMLASGFKARDIMIKHGFNRNEYRKFLSKIKAKIEKANV